MAHRTLAEQRIQLDRLLSKAEALTAEIAVREEREKTKPNSQGGAFKVYDGSDGGVKIAACNPATGAFTGYWTIVSCQHMSRATAERACGRLNQWLAELVANRLSV